MKVLTKKIKETKWLKAKVKILKEFEEIHDVEKNVEII